MVQMLRIWNPTVSRIVVVPLISRCMNEYRPLRQLVVLIYYVSAGPQSQHIRRSYRRPDTHVKYTIASLPLFFGTACLAFGLSTSYFQTCQYAKSIQLTSSFSSAATTTAVEGWLPQPSLATPGVVHEGLFGKTPGLRCRIAIVMKRHADPKKKSRQDSLKRAVAIT